jgi:hypothetical protein
MKTTSPLMRLRWAADDAARLRLAGEFAAELSRLQGFGLDPQPGSHHAWLTIEDGSVLVEFDYSAGSPGRTYGPPEDCYEAEAEEVTLLNVLVNGAWIDAQQFRDELLQRWEAEVIEHMAQMRDDDLAGLAEARGRHREFA